MKDISEEVESIYNDFENVLITTGKDFTILSKSGSIVGYCNKYKGIYRVVYPITKDKDIDDRIKMHEYGHIYLGHLEGVYEELDKKLCRIIRNKDRQLIDLINKNCGIDYADSLLDKVINDPFLNHRIHNIAMDLEVNSTILDEDDLNLITEKVNNLIFEEYKKLSNGGKKLPSDKEMNNLYSNFNMKGVLPSQFGFNKGLTYPDYLVKLILNLDQVLRMLSNQYNDKDRFKNAMNGNGKGEKSEVGNGSPQEGENEDINKNIPKTKEEFEEMMKNASSSMKGSSDESDDNSSNGGGSSKPSQDNNGENDKSNKSESNSDDGNNDESDKTDCDHGTDSRSESDKRRKESLGNYESDGGDGRGSNKSYSVRNYNINNDPLDLALTEILRDVRHKVIKRDFSKDMTYKYNRKILGKDNRMLSPTYRQRITRTENPTIAFFVDVSGSMNSRLVDRIITNIRNGMKIIDRSLKYSIVTWDTELCEYFKDINSDTPIPEISSGGGTDLAGTFDFFKKNFGIDSIMVIISDFEDALNKWHDREKLMNGYSMYGLKYGKMTWYNNGVMPDWKNLKVRQCD